VHDRQKQRRGCRRLSSVWRGNVRRRLPRVRAGAVPSRRRCHRRSLPALPKGAVPKFAQTGFLPALHSRSLHRHGRCYTVHRVPRQCSHVRCRRICVHTLRRGRKIRTRLCQVRQVRGRRGRHQRERRLCTVRGRNIPHRKHECHDVRGVPFRFLPRRNGKCVVPAVRTRRVFGNRRWRGVRVVRKKHLFQKQAPEHSVRVMPGRAHVKRGQYCLQCVHARHV
jgi:hypothetical protein